MIEFSVHPTMDQFSMGKILAKAYEEVLEEGLGTAEPRWRGIITYSNSLKLLELRNVLAVIRHGDRTPKQKVKIKVSHPSILALFDNKEDTTKQVGNSCDNVFTLVADKT